MNRKVPIDYYNSLNTGMKRLLFVLSISLSLLSIFSSLGLIGEFAGDIDSFDKSMILYSIVLGVGAVTFLLFWSLIILVLWIIEGFKK